MTATAELTVSVCDGAHGFAPDLPGVPPCPGVRFVRFERGHPYLELATVPWWFIDYPVPVGLPWTHPALCGWSLTVLSVRREMGRDVATIQFTPPLTGGRK